MCTVRELKEFLNKLPDDLNVEVLEERNSTWDSYTIWNDLELGYLSENCNIIGESLYLGRT